MTRVLARAAVVGLVLAAALVLVARPPAEVARSSGEAASAVRPASANEAIAGMLGGLIDPDRLARVNPALHADLVALHAAERARGAGPAAIHRALERRAMAAYAEQIRRAPDRLTARHWAIFAAALRATLDDGPARCVAFIAGDTRNIALSVYQLRALRALAAETLVTPADPDVVEGNGIFNISHPLVDRVARDTGLSRQAVLLAIHNQGDASGQCRAFIRIVEIVTQLEDAEARKLLREL